MVAFSIGVLIITLLAMAYALFFVTGGCISLFLTALNDKLTAGNKFRWMLAQVYFPPTTIAYLAVAEKNRKYQIIGAIGILLALYMPIHIITSLDWQKLKTAAPTILSGFEEGLKKAANQEKEKEERKENNTQNHQQKELVDAKSKMLKERLESIEKTTTVQKDIQNLAAVKMIFSLSLLGYQTDDISESDFIDLLNKLDVATSSGALSDQDAKNWVAAATTIIKKNNGSATTQPPIAVPQPVTPLQQRPAANTTIPDQQRAGDVFSKKAERTSAHMFAIYNASPASAAKQALDQTDALLGNLRGAYVYQQLPPSIYNQLLDDLDQKLSSGALSVNDANSWMANAQQIIQGNLNGTLAPMPQQGR